MSFNFVSPATYEDHEHEVFTEPSMCDKTSFEPLTMTMERMMQSGRVAGNARRAMYDYSNEMIDMEKAQTMPVYGGDMVDMTNYAREAESNAKKIVEEANKVKESAEVTDESV